MADPFGITFSPGQRDPNNPQVAPGQKPTPIQQAIQTLSLRIPRVAGASAFTAQPLLNSPGGLGLSGDVNSASILEALKRYLFGGQPTTDQGQQGFQPFGNQPTGLEQLFGIPTQPTQPITSGTGQPLGTGTGTPLPTGGGVPPPVIIPGGTMPKDNTIPPTPTPTPRPEPQGQINDHIRYI